MSSLVNFRVLLKNELMIRGLHLTQWLNANRISANLLQIHSKPKSLILYVKVSNSNPGFWGLTANQLKTIRGSNLDSYVVLLTKASDQGYLLSMKDVDNRIENGTLELSGDGDHKVNEKSDLTPEMKFKGIADFVSRILNEK